MITLSIVNLFNFVT